MSVMLRLIVFVASMGIATMAWTVSGRLLDHVNLESPLVRGLCGIVILGLGWYIGIKMVLWWRTLRIPSK